MLCFQGGSLLADFASLIQESKEDVHTVCCVLCFQGGSLLADFASLIQESKERCIYSKLYAVCYVFRAVRCWLRLADAGEHNTHVYTA